MNLVAQKVLYVLSIGIVNILTGKTMYDWSIYDHVGGHVPTVSLTRNGSLLYGGGGEIGADIELRGNDSQRLLGKDQIVDNCPSTKDEVLAMLKKHGYDYYPIKAFRKRAGGNRKLKTSYSVK
jgi:hypothetical protein